MLNRAQRGRKCVKKSKLYLYQIRVDTKRASVVLGHWITSGAHFDGSGHHGGGCSDDCNRNRTQDFYSAHKSEVARTSLFTGAYSKQNQGMQIQRVGQVDSQTAMVDDV